MNHVVKIYDDYVKIEGLQMMVTHSFNNAAAINVEAESSGLIEISGGIFRGNFSGTAGGMAVKGANLSVAELTFYNNIVYDFDRAPAINLYSLAKIYNNTFHNNIIGLSSYNKTNEASNNIFSNSISKWVYRFRRSPNHSSFFA